MIFRKKSNEKEDNLLIFDEGFEEEFEEFYQHFNSKQRELAWCYTLARHPRECYHCKKSFEELIERAQIQEELNEKKRKYPVVVLENLENNGRHCEPNDPNLVPSCYSCNRNKDKFSKSQASSKELTRSKQDTLKHEPIYHHNLKTLLLDEEEVCFHDLKIGGTSLSDGMNEVTTLRYFNSKRLTKVNKTGIYQVFPHNCGSQDCNGAHVCLVGMVPKNLILQERYDLEKIYNREYHNGDAEAFKHHASTFGKTFIGFDEFYSQRAKLLKEFPNLSVEEIKSWI